MSNIEEIDVRRFVKELNELIPDREMQILLCKIYIQGYDHCYSGAYQSFNKIKRVLKHLEGL